MNTRNIAILSLALLVLGAASPTRNPRLDLTFLGRTSVQTPGRSEALESNDSADGERRPDVREGNIRCRLPL